MIRPRARVGALMFTASLCGSLSIAPRAGAEVTKEQCVDANAGAQDLRREGRLSAAREMLQRCADPACPAMVRDDCVKRLDEVERLQPSIVLDVKDGSGADLTAVRVTLDGKPLVERLDGKPLRVDPGVRVFVLEAAGLPAATVKLLVKEGEAGRAERVVLGQVAVAPAPREIGALPGPVAPSLGPQRILGLALGGAGAIGLGIGAATGLLAASAWSSAKSACGGDPARCTDTSAASSFRSTAESDGAVSTVGFIAAGVLLAAGAATFFSAPREPSPLRGVSLAPAVGARQAGLALLGVF